LPRPLASPTGSIHPVMDPGSDDAPPRSFGLPEALPKPLACAVADAASWAFCLQHRQMWRTASERPICSRARSCAFRAFFPAKLAIVGCLLTDAPTLAPSPTNGRRIRQCPHGSIRAKRLPLDSHSVQWRATLPQPPKEARHPREYRNRNPTLSHRVARAQCRETKVGSHASARWPVAGVD
jgi:hypothetical protein